MKNDFAKRRQRGCFTIPKYLFILPCNTVYLFVCLYVCCPYLQYNRPYGRRQITAWTSPIPLPLQIWALTLKPKKKKKKHDKRRRNIFQQCNSVCFVSMYAQIHSVSSFNDDDFTKTVFIIREDKEYLFTGSTVCVCSDT